MAGFNFDQFLGLGKKIAAAGKIASDVKVLTDDFNKAHNDPAVKAAAEASPILKALLDKTSADLRNIENDVHTVLH